MNTLFVIIGLSICILAIGILGMAFNIVFRKTKFPSGSVGKNPELKKKGLSCEKCDELKRCEPKLEEKRERKAQTLQALDEILKL